MIKDLFPNAVPNIPDALADMTPAEYESMPLTAPVPGFQIDIERLQHHFRTVVLPIDPVVTHRDPVNRPTHKFSGWSVTSLDGSMSSGWESNKGYTAVGKYDPEVAKAAGFTHRLKYNKKTPICTGYLEEVVDMVADLGFHPCRVRIWGIDPGDRLGVHTDGASNSYNVRLHIPIITNDKSFHVWYTDPEVSHHFEADGRAHMFRTNVNHSAYNAGTEPRYHLVFEVWDTKGIVPGFKFTRMAEVLRQAETY